MTCLTCRFRFFLWNFHLGEGVRKRRENPFFPAPATATRDKKRRGKKTRNVRTSPEALPSSPALSPARETSTHGKPATTRSIP